MQKVIVIGCPGSGKSTFARKLHDITKIPLYHLDMMNWNADKTTVPKTVFRERLQNVMEQDSWIIDGNYGSTIEMRLRQCNTVFFLDYPTEVCLKGIAERKGKTRTDMPWVEEPHEEDEEFVFFIKKYNTVSRPKVISLLNCYSDKSIFIFHKREDADNYLKTIIIDKFQNLHKVRNIHNNQKSLLLPSTEMSDFYGKGTLFLCLLRIFSQRNGKDNL